MWYEPSLVASSRSSGPPTRRERRRRKSAMDAMRNRVLGYADHYERPRGHSRSPHEWNRIPSNPRASDAFTRMSHRGGSPRLACWIFIQTSTLLIALIYRAPWGVTVVIGKHSDRVRLDRIKNSLCSLSRSNWRAICVAILRKLSRQKIEPFLDRSRE